MLRYWYALLHGKFKVWQLIGLGCFWIALGIGLLIEIGTESPTAKVIVLLMFCGSGVAHFVIAWKALRDARRHDDKLAELDVREAALAERDAAPRPPSPRAEPARPSPPRLGDDPFRDPPAAAPIVVETTLKVPAPMPVVAGNPDDKPKLLI